jgi:pyruvate/2-oxoglutarate dehydrogenase complex dihydrolipoamide acyltransferase (E2) component
VFKLNVQEGDVVAKGDVLLVIESMKMENRILSTKDAIVQKINVSLHDMIEASTVLVVLGENKKITINKTYIMNFDLTQEQAVYQAICPRFCRKGNQTPGQRA